MKELALVDKTEYESIWAWITAGAQSGERSWLHRHPSRIDECVEQRAEAMPRPLGPEEIEQLKARHRDWGADDRTMRSIDLMAEDNVRVVVAGQQPAPLGGPLYSVYKALGAIELAESLARRHDSLTFIPVFWVASEDHDFHEVRRVFWPGSGGELQEVWVENPAWTPGRMIGNLPCGDLATTLTDRIVNSTHDSEFRKDLLDRIKEAYAPDQTWEDAFCRFFLSMFPDSGLVIVSPLMDWVRRRAVPILQHEARSAGASSAAIIERGKALEASGLPAPLHRRSDAINFFRIDEQERRHALRLTDAGIEGSIPGAAESEDEGNTIASSGEELAALIEAEPTHFSFNVVTRPMVQDFILPTVAQIVGPGEAAYFAQVEAVYEDFGVFSPVRYPRPSLALIENRIARVLKKYDIAPADAIAMDAGRLEKMVVERDRDKGIAGEIAALHEEHKRSLTDLREHAGKDSSVTTAITKLEQMMDKGYGVLIDRVTYAQHKDAQHVGDAMRKIESSLRPGGKPQERMLNAAVPFMIHYGPDWIARLRTLLRAEAAPEPQIIHLSDLPAVEPGGSEAG